MVKSKIGIEAEFLLVNDKGKVIVPPATFDRDGFPLLAEIRGEAGESVVEVLSNFELKRLETLERLKKDHTMSMVNSFEVPLSTYRAANKQTNWSDKQASMGLIENIYDVDIEDYSDQIVKNGKIQGIRVSCGLHIHFSCEDTSEVEVRRQKYERVEFPINFYVPDDTPDQQTRAIEQMIRPYIYLYRDAGYEVEQTLTARASKLNGPTIRWIVRSMDKEFFERFAPPKSERTKYRQAGFYERKPYGFEYRSLPANSDTLAALPDIVKFAFKLLKEAAT